MFSQIDNNADCGRSVALRAFDSPFVIKRGSQVRSYTLTGQKLIVLIPGKTNPQAGGVGNFPLEHLVTLT